MGSFAGAEWDLLAVGFEHVLVLLSLRPVLLSVDQFI